MADSKALVDFRQSIAMAEELLKEEKKHGNPPRKAEQPLVGGLRGGAAVLMVASFEAYLRQAMIEHLSELTKHPPPVEFGKLPEKLRVNSTFYCLDAALKGPRYQETKKVDRLTGIKVVCGKVVADVIDPTALSSTQGNPDSETVKGMFSDIGVTDLFGKIHTRFQTRWKKPIASTFVRDKLDEIVKRRHAVAHTGKSLDIGRSDLAEGVKFLRLLASILDATFAKHIADIMKP